MKGAGQKKTWGKEHGNGSLFGEGVTKKGKAKNLTYLTKNGGRLEAT